MVIGCLNECDFKKINKKNVKAIFKGTMNKWYFPCPDYGTRRQIFTSMIRRAGGGKLTTAFDLNTLAHMTERYPAGSYQYAIEKVLTTRRKNKLDKKPLTVNEFLAPLSSSYCLYDDDNKNFQKFTDEICLYKKRFKLAHPEDGNDKGGKGKGKKGKGK